MQNSIQKSDLLVIISLTKYSSVSGITRGFQLNTTIVACHTLFMPPLIHQRCQKIIQNGLRTPGTNLLAVLWNFWRISIEWAGIRGHVATWRLQRTIIQCLLTHWAFMALNESSGWFLCLKGGKSCSEIKEVKISRLFILCNISWLFLLFHANMQMASFHYKSTHWKSITIYL